MSDSMTIPNNEFCRLKSVLMRKFGDDIEIGRIHFLNLVCDQHSNVSAYVGLITSERHDLWDWWLVLNGNFEDPIIGADHFYLAPEISKKEDQSIRDQLDGWCRNDHCRTSCSLKWGTKVGLNQSQLARLINGMMNRLDKNARPDKAYFKLTSCAKQMPLPIYCGDTKWIRDGIYRDVWWLVLGDDFSRAMFFEGKLLSDLRGEVAKVCSDGLCNHACSAMEIFEAYSKITQGRLKSNQERLAISFRRKPRGF